MRDWLLYWKFYWTEVEEDPSSFNDDWYAAQKRFFTRVQPGDTLWAVVTGGAEYPEEVAPPTADHRSPEKACAPL